MFVARRDMWDRRPPDIVLGIHMVVGLICVTIGHHGVLMSVVSIRICVVELMARNHAICLRNILMF